MLLLIARHGFKLSMIKGLFKFFASLRCAVILILAVAIVVAAGTFIESYHGAQAAQSIVYRTPWFSFLLLFLVLNLLASALERLPWQKKHTGFLMTHLGIILILLGAFVSQNFGTEGQLQIREGTSASYMTLQSPFRPIIEIASRDSNEHLVYHFKPNALPWTGKAPLIPQKPGSIEGILLADYPSALLEEKVVPQENGVPAIHVQLEGMMAETTQWLLLDDREKGNIMLGPATIRFTKNPIQPEKVSSKKEGAGRLKFEFKDHSTTFLSLDDKKVLKKKFSLEGVPLKVVVKRILKDAFVEENQLKDRGDDWRNPAVEIEIESGDTAERHTVFANFPEFPTMHGRGENRFGVKITYEREASASGRLSKNELRFFIDSKGILRYQSKRGNDIKEGEVKINQREATGWMDFHFIVDQYEPRAQIVQDFVPVSGISEQAGVVPVIYVGLKRKDEFKELWLIQGETASVHFSDKSYEVTYGLENVSLGYQVELKDFIIETNPGTNQPASFKSEVTLKDAAYGIERDTTIWMNHPLVHRGYKIYQSAYRQNPGEPDISIFTVARDPGLWMKYTGAIILISGILILFYVSKFSSLKSSDPKMRRK